MSSNRYRELTRDANSVYKQGRFREAALLNEQAYHLAQQSGSEREVFNSGTWAATCWGLGGEPLRSLGLLSDLLREISPEAAIQDICLARQRAFEVQRCYFPQLSALQQRLHALETLQSEQPQLPISDIHNTKALLYQHQGSWSAGLQQAESAWRQYSGAGYLKFLFAYKACINSLKLQQLSAAQDWCNALGETDKEQAHSRATWQEAQTQLALYRQQPVQAQHHADALEDIALSMQSSDFDFNIHFQGRTRLLQTPAADPQDSEYPCRRRFAQRYPGKPDVFDVYRRRLLLLDYRLACLRWALNISPVDDLWYTQAQDLTTAKLQVTAQSAQRRVFLARRAVKRVMKQAEYLDECFETKCWTDEVKAHEQRLEALVVVLRELT